jgi:hydroxypyruvate isomerase
MNIDYYRKILNKQQTELRKIMMSFDQHDRAIELFLKQHAMLHSAKMAQSGLWSFEDEVLKDMTEERIRCIPQNCEHSVAWCIWHIARIEDVTMNILVGGNPQVISQDKWLERMNIKFCDTGNSIDDESMAELSETIDIKVLRKYRIAVGQKTREIVKHLQVESLKQRVDTLRIQKVRDEGAVVEAASGIVDYWNKRNIAGLLLMPPTRHCIIHLNEALRLKKRQN